MPTFQPTLSPVDTRDASFISRGVTDRSGEATAKAAETLLGLAGEVSDQGTKSEVTEELADINAQQIAFRTKEEELSTDLLGTKDKDRLTEVGAEIKKLERGEVTGTLSSSRANLLKSTLRSKVIQDNPHMAKELNSLFSSFSLPKGTDSPEKRAIDDRRERAATNGISLFDQTVADNNNFNRKEAVARADQALRQGTANEASETNRLGAVTEENVGSVLQQIRSVVQSDPSGIDQTEWSTIVQLAQSKAMRQNQMRMAELEGKGFSFSKAYRDGLEKDIQDQFGILTGFVEAKDKVNYFTRLEAIQKGQDSQTFRTKNKEFSQLANVIGNEMAFKMSTEILPLAMKASAKGRDQLELGAANGDKDSILTLQMLDGGIGGELLVRNIQNRIAVKEGSADALMTRLVAGNVINATGTEDPASKSFIEAAVDMLTTTTAPVRELEHFLKPGAQLNMTKDSLAKVNRRADQSEVSLRQGINRLHEFAPRIVVEGGSYRWQRYNRLNETWSNFTPPQISDQKDLIDSLNVITKLNRTYGYKEPLWEPKLIEELNTVNTPDVLQPEPSVPRPEGSIFTDEEFARRREEFLNAK